MHDVETVGGKNASLGEMIGSLAKLGVQVPGGFATTAHAYRQFLQQGGLDARIRAELAGLDVDDVTRLAATGARIRGWILATPFPPEIEKAVLEELRKTGRKSRWPCALQPRRKTYPRHLLQGSKKPS
jgi:pyruvate,water dikinase